MSLLIDLNWDGRKASAICSLDGEDDVIVEIENGSQAKALGECVDELGRKPHLHGGEWRASNGMRGTIGPKPRKSKQHTNVASSGFDLPGGSMNGHRGFTQ